MKILYVCQYYPPEIGAPSARVSELSGVWVTEGHEVTVLTGFPNHPTGKIPPEYRAKLRRLVMRDDKDGVRVERTWLLPLPNRKAWERMLNYASFCISAALRGLFLSRPQVVIATSPQLLVGLSGLIIAKLRRVPLIFEVRDLWPESLEAVGVSGQKSLLVRMLGKVAGLLYRQSDHIVVVTKSFKTHLEDRWGVSPSKISVVVNGVDHKFFSPQVEQAGIAEDFGLTGRFVVAYIGTIGNAHGIETLVEVAGLLKVSDPDVFFLVVGEGAEKQRLEKMVAGKQLSNVGIFPGQPRSRIPSILAASQLCMVLLRKSELFKTVIPTKMLEYMSCGRPLVAAVEGEAEELIRNAHAGICVEPGDAKALAEAIGSLRRNPGLIQELGGHARDFIVHRLSRESTAQEYLSVLEAVSARTQPLSRNIVGH